jgi:hypothetical protein
VRSLALVSLLLAAGATACTTPGFPDIPDQPDAAPPTPDAKLDCELKVQSVGDGHHNPGQNCLDCHNGQQQAQGAPIFTIGGTLYKDAAGTIPRIGATVIIIDSNGKVVKVPTQQNGNFYSSAQLTAPYSLGVSECPGENKPMISQTPDGDCNSCHTGAGAPGRILF